MTILQSLAEFYDRLDRRGKRDGEILVPSTGLKLATIDYILEIDATGRAIALKSRISADKKRGSKLMVPGTVYNPKLGKGETPWEDLSFRGRTSGRRSFLFWDKSSYVLGVALKKAVEGSVLEPEISQKSRSDHAAFVAAHREVLEGTTDPGLLALLQFLDTWSPEQWAALAFPTDALDKNIAFEVAGSRRFIHDLAEARRRAAEVIAAATPARPCLVSGVAEPYAAGHPIFQGVAGAQSSGAPLVSFNKESFISYGLDKAEAAPVSEDAAFKYGAALNWLLARGNGRSFRLGETTVVLWADDKPHAEDAEDQIVGEMSDGAPLLGGSPGDDDGGQEEDGAEDGASEFDIDTDQAQTLQEQGQNARFLRRAPNAANLHKDARLHVLGLSPNAGRIAVRFWLVETWGHIQQNIARFKDDMSIEPPSGNPNMKAYALLFETAAQREPKNIPPRLGGELARAVLSGAPYPQTLLAAVVARVRADKIINAERAAICKAVLKRNLDLKEFPVALEHESNDPAYNLGRLFAVYEYAEKAVADRNATIKDKFIGAASATPRRVFPILMRGYEHNASALAKQDGNRRGAGIKAARAVSQILGLFGGEMPFPTALRLEDQGRFFVGYYHQNKALYTKSDGDGADTDAEGTKP